MIVKRQVAWSPCWRVIAARYADERIFEKIGSKDDLPLLTELEQMTNDRVRIARGEIPGFLPQDLPTGPGSELIIAAFANRPVGGGRFSDAEIGACYVAHELETAVAETRFHAARFMNYTKEEPILLQMRVLRIDLDGKLHDIRGRREEFSSVYSERTYRASQQLAHTLKDEGSEGIAYDSVRREKGQCSAVFRPAALSNCRRDIAMIYEWDGTKISKTFTVNEF